MTHAWFQAQPDQLYGHQLLQRTSSFPQCNGITSYLQQVDQPPQGIDVIDCQKKDAVQLTVRQLRQGCAQYQSVINLLDPQAFAVPFADCQIFHIHNKSLLQLHAVVAVSMEERADGIGANVRRLWHGTSEDTVEYITNLGFNRSFSQTAVYGKGVYFARDASYSMSPTYAQPDSNGYQYMFLCRVLVGHSTRGNGSYSVPPVRDPQTLVRYDTLVDRLENPTIFVSGHHDPQCYPEYLVKFKRL